MFIETATALKRREFGNLLNWHLTRAMICVTHKKSSRNEFHCLVDHGEESRLG